MASFSRHNYHACLFMHLYGVAYQACLIVYGGVVSYTSFLLFLIKLSFSDTTVIEGGRERKHS